ncbi:MAG: hypothetical protein ACUZ8I_07685 [Candidatus Scalindua sp.]
MFQTILTNLVIGLLAALGTSMGTYVAKMKAGEQFDVKKFGRTMAAGLGAGITTGLLGGNADSVDGAIATMGASAGLVNIIDQGVKFIWRLFSRRE